jgi:hypothetical protein
LALPIRLFKPLAITPQRKNIAARACSKPVSNTKHIEIIEKQALAAPFYLCLCPTTLPTPLS